MLRDCDGLSEPERLHPEGGDTGQLLTAMIQALIEIEWMHDAVLLYITIIFYSCVCTVYVYTIYDEIMAGLFSDDILVR